MSEHIEKLDEHVVALVTEVQMLRFEGQKTRKWSRWAVVTAVLAILALFPNALLLLRLNDVANDNHASNQILVECTTPSTHKEKHECYEDGQRRTAEAVKQIVCALKPETPGCEVL